MPVSAATASARSASAIASRNALLTYSRPAFCAYAFASSGAGRQRLKQRHRLVVHLLRPRVAGALQQDRERREDAGDGDVVAASPVEAERLLERIPGIVQLDLLLGGAGPADEQRRALGMARWRQLERLRQARLGARHVEDERALAREREVPDRRGLEIGIGVPRGARELERLQVVVGEDVGEVLGAVAGLALDPGGGGAMPCGANGARHLGVADVPYQHVPEAVLGLVGHRARAGGPDELLAGELVQRLLDLAGLAIRHLGQCTGPEDLPDHRRVLEQALALG